MWYIVYVDPAGHGYRAIIDKTGKPNKYGEKKLFKTKKEAQQWIDRKSYFGMPHYYELKKVEQ